MNHSHIFFLIILGLLASQSGFTLVNGQMGISDVPAEYAKLYSTLKLNLDQFDDYLNSRTANGTNSPLFAAELLQANDNRGTELLNPNVMQSVRVYLDRLQELGVQGVTFPIGYPLYTPTFPHYQDYVQFYRQVVQEVRKRGMTIDIESAAIFANTPFSPFKLDYSNLTFEQFKIERKLMIQTIIQDLHPDYLNLGSEPDTEAQLLRIKELNEPNKYTEYINYLITGLDRGTTKVGSGIGTWGDLAYVTDLVNTSIDSIHIHVYPITSRFLQNLFTISEIAKEHGKRVILDEAWLYKTDIASANGVAASSDIFRRDLFSFFAPLDQQFLATLVKAAQLANIDYVSPFWTQLFFGYSDYDQNTAQMSYGQLVSMTNQIASQNIVSDQFSQTGLTYKALISQQTPTSASTSSLPTLPQTQAGRGMGIFAVGTAIVALSVFLSYFPLKKHHRAK